MKKHLSFMTALFMSVTVFCFPSASIHAEEEPVAETSEEADENTEEQTSEELSETTEIIQTETEEGTASKEAKETDDEAVKESAPEENDHSGDNTVIEKTEEESFETEIIEESAAVNEEVYSAGNSYADAYTLYLDEGIRIQSEGSEKYFVFTPSKSGKYTFSSSGSSDTFARLFYNYPDGYVEDDDSGSSLNFSVTYDLVKGKDYYLCVHGYSNSSFSCTVAVTADSFIEDETDGLVRGDDGRLYYYDENGVMQKGWQTIAGKKYYFKTDGAAELGFKLVDGKYVYLHKPDGYVVTGFQTINGKYYFFDENGYMFTGGWKQVSGKWYFFKTNGAAEKGWKVINGKYYFMDRTTAVRASGLQTVDGKTYFFNSDGTMFTGGWKQVSGTWYFFKTNGAAEVGWKKTGGKWYYLHKPDGAMLTGWQKIDGKKYYFNGSGAMATGWIKLYDDEDGEYLWYYLKSSGALATGWQKISGKWYYLNEYMYWGGYYDIGGTRYWFKYNGEMISGWGRIVGDGDDYWVYCKSSGAGYTGWIKSGKDWYYAEKGDLYYGLYIIDGVRYCFDDYTGAMDKDIFVFDISSESVTSWPYHFDADGKGTNGWRSYGGYSYYYVNGYPSKRR